jgi:hypothetical protein
MTDKRIVCWFSCGAASAVATKIAIEENAKGANLPIEVVRCYVKEEHHDNERFAADCEKWFGVPITVLKNEKYKGSIYETFAQRKYISGIAGAPCTTYLKKELRKGFERFGDIQVFGYTAEEQDRVDRFIDGNNDVNLWPVLVEKGLMHSDCLAIVSRSGIELPQMYKLGYRNNNCIGCVKGGAGYWNKIRVDFPVEFSRMAIFSKTLGVRLVKFEGERVFLEDLPETCGDYPSEPEIQCGIFCEMAEREMAA